MNIPIFEIIILLFILFPFIKQLIDQLKGEQPKSPEQIKRERQQRREERRKDPWESPEEYDWGGGQEQKSDWEDAFKELEEVFTGKSEQRKSESQMPRRERSETKKQPEREKGPAKTTTTQHSEPIQLSENPYQAEMPDFQHQDHESLEIGASNPIYNELLGSKRDRKAPKAARQIRKTIEDPESLRAAFIFKEVLDKPGGRPRRYSSYS